MTFLMLLTSAYYLSWPLHQLFGTIFSTLTAPLNLLLALVRFTEPLWSLAGGLLGAGATLGGTFAWLGNKVERRVYIAHEERAERRRVEELEREVERREEELARERERADEQERWSRALMVAGAAQRRRTRLPVPPGQGQKSLFAVLLRKVFGTHKTLQEEYEEYYADLAVLEPEQGQIVAWDVEAEQEERHHHPASAYTVGGSRLLIAPADPGIKKRARRAGRGPARVQQPMVLHHPPDRGHRVLNDRPEQDGYIPDLHHHPDDDSLPSVHTPPTDGLPPTPRRVVRARQPHLPQQPFMTFPTGIVRPVGTRVRGASVGGGQGRRITFADGLRTGEEDEPVEGEVFGYPDNVEEESDRSEDPQDRDEDARLAAGTSNIHLHFHHGAASKSTSTSGRRKRTLRFQEDDHTARDFISLDQAYHDPGDKYGTPFKRSSTRVERQAKQAFDGDGNGMQAEVTSTGMLFGQGDGMRRRLVGEAELDL